MSGPAKRFAKPLKVFVSYAHADEGRLDRLRKLLQPLVDQGRLGLWHDRRITAGQDWAKEIDAALDAADVVLLLISGDFLGSGYCTGIEMARAIELWKQGQVRVVPVILSSCDWRHSPAARFQALPTDGRPVTEAEHPDQLYTQVAAGLRAVADELLRPAVPPVDVVPPVIHSQAAGSSSRRGRLVLAAGVLALVMTALLLSVPAALADARAAMRMGRYDLAVQRLGRIPPGLDLWPGVRDLRAIAALGADTFDPDLDREDFGLRLRELRRRLPHDAVLLVLEAQEQLLASEREQARALVRQASAADPSNAEAWFLQGLIEDESSGNLHLVAQHYRQAAQAAPDSPHYRSNLARALLDAGKYGEAIGVYRGVYQFPLARVEQALGHWARGELVMAADLQRQALTMLADSRLLEHFHNRREWVFFLRDKGYALATVADKRCYAQLGEAASRRLLGDAAAAFPPADCAQLPQELRELLAQDLCRFVDRPQPALAPRAQALRGVLGQPVACPPAPAAPAVRS